jgi:hypothetical protein
MTTPTPETDALALKQSQEMQSPYSDNSQMYEHARKLERERDEARAIAEQARQEVRDLRIERHVAQNQRDNALKQMATYGGIEDLLCPEFEGIDDLVECFRLLKAELTQLQKVCVSLKHPQIHLDYYKWLETAKEDNFWKSKCSFEVFHSIAMWVWSCSRETANQPTLE